MSLTRSDIYKKVRRLFGGSDATGWFQAMTIVNADGLPISGVGSIPPLSIPAGTNETTISTNGNRYVILKFDNFSYNFPNSSEGGAFTLLDSLTLPTVNQAAPSIWEMNSLLPKNLTKTSPPLSRNKLYIVETLGLPFLKIKEDNANTFSAVSWTTDDDLSPFYQFVSSVLSYTQAVGTDIISGYSYFKITHLSGAGTVTYDSSGQTISLPLGASFEVPLSSGMNVYTSINIEVTGTAVAQIDLIKPQ